VRSNKTPSTIRRGAIHGRPPLGRNSTAGNVTRINSHRSSGIRHSTGKLRRRRPRLATSTPPPPRTLRATRGVYYEIAAGSRIAQSEEGSRSRDRHIRVGHGRYLAAHIPGAKYVELPGEDNLFHVGDTETMLGEIEEFLTGVRSPVEVDRILATVLFTDIVNSTERAATLGDRRWRDLLEGHQSLVRQELARFRGREVKALGDGFLATFDGPARAIRCACAIRDGVRGLGIEIRAGLHTGECERMGEDVGGIAVHIGARVVASATPGEVLVSSTVKDLVAGSGLRFVDNGTHNLSGVPGEWRLFAVGS
jgi:class 3 adenylate cyclase